MPRGHRKRIWLDRHIDRYVLDSKSSVRLHRAIREPIWHYYKCTCNSIDKNSSTLDLMEFFNYIFLSRSSNKFYQESRIKNISKNSIK